MIQTFQHLDPRSRRPRRESVARWYALSTRARHEKQVDARLRERGFEVYLPLIPSVRQWHDRKKVVEWPLFPGYVFARFEFDAAWRALATPGVAAVVRANGDAAPIADEEIENVRRFAAVIAETGSVPQPTPLVRQGQRVRFVHGPFTGVEGLVIESRSGRAIVQVGLEAIEQGLRVDADISSLRVIGEVQAEVAFR